MKAVATSFTNKMAGITGRVILYSYKVYVSLFSKKRGYYEMTTELPVKREIILLKRKSGTAACSLN
jgi:hypothetical protein